MWKRFLHVVFILFCLEIGLFLVVLPWSDFWQHNGLFLLVPGLQKYLVSGYARGALTGLGLLNIWVGLSDIWHFRTNLATMEQIEQEEARMAQKSAALPASADSEKPKS